MPETQREIIVKDEAGRRFRVKYTGEPPSAEDLLPQLQTLQKRIIDRDMQSGYANEHSYSGKPNSVYPDQVRQLVPNLVPDPFPDAFNSQPAQTPRAPRLGDGSTISPAPQRSPFENMLIDLQAKMQLGNRDLVKKLTGENNRPKPATNAAELGTNLLEGAARIPGILASLPLSVINQAEDFAAGRNAVNSLQDTGFNKQADALAKQVGKKAVGATTGLVLPFAGEIAELGYEGPDAALQALKSRALTDPASFAFDALGILGAAKGAKNARANYKEMRADYYDAQNAKTNARAKAAQDAFDAQSLIEPKGYQRGGTPRTPAPQSPVTPPSNRGLQISPNKPVTPANNWRVTHYGQRDPKIETTPDTNSVKLRKGFNENGLDNDSFAAPPDVAAELKREGIGPQDIVEFVLSDGRRIYKRYDDATSPSLSGRIDLFTAEGRNPLEGATIVGFKKAGRGTKLALGTSTEAKLTQPEGTTSALPQVPTPEVTPEAKADQMLAALDQQLGLNKPSKLPGFESQQLPKPEDIKAPQVAPPTVTDTPLISESPKQNMGGFGAPPEEIEAVRKKYAIDPKEQIDDVAYASDNTPVPYRWRVADISELIPSHNPDFTENPRFPSELQPRDRTEDAVSQVQVAKIASDPNPRRLAISPNISDGSPMAFPESDLADPTKKGLLIEGGNARVLAMGLIYRDPKLAKQAAKIRKFIAGYAPLVGQSVEGKPNPVLIRERVGALSPEERVALVQKMNNAGTMSRSDSEDATYDAERVNDAGLMELLDGTKGVGARENRSFVEAYFKNLPVEQLGNVFDKQTKSLSTSGQTRVNDALLASAFSDAPAGKGLVADLINSNGIGIGANLARSIRESSVALSKLAYLSKKQGSDLAIANDLAVAAKRLASFDSRKQALDWLEQQKSGDLFGGSKGSISDKTELAFLDILAQDEYAKSGVRTSDLLRRYSQMAIDELTKPVLDKSKPASKLELLARADAIVRKKEGEAIPQTGFDFAEPEPVNEKPTEQPAKKGWGTEEDAAKREAEREQSIARAAADKAERDKYKADALKPVDPSKLNAPNTSNGLPYIHVTDPTNGKNYTIALRNPRDGVAVILDGHVTSFLKGEVNMIGDPLKVVNVSAPSINGRRKLQREALGSAISQADTMLKGYPDAELTPVDANLHPKAPVTPPAPQPEPVAASTGELSPTPKKTVVKKKPVEPEKPAPQVSVSKAPSFELVDSIIGAQDFEKAVKNADTIDGRMEILDQGVRDITRASAEEMMNRADGRAESLGISIPGGGHYKIFMDLVKSSIFDPRENKYTAALDVVRRSRDLNISKPPTAYNESNASSWLDWVVEHDREVSKFAANDYYWEKLAEKPDASLISEAPKPAAIKDEKQSLLEERSAIRNKIDKFTADSLEVNMEAVGRSFKEWDAVRSKWVPLLKYAAGLPLGEASQAAFKKAFDAKRLAEAESTTRDPEVARINAIQEEKFRVIPKLVERLAQIDKRLIEIETPEEKAALDAAAERLKSRLETQRNPDALTKPVVQERLALEAPVTTTETISTAAKLGDRQLAKQGFESGADLIAAKKAERAAKLAQVKANVQKTLDQEDC